ncbi:MAG: GNAT family N-acetyltransferase [Bacilli bacterium]
MIHFELTTIRTSRTILRKPELSDGESMFRNWSSDPKVTQYLSWYPHENVGTSQLMITLWRDMTPKAQLSIWVCELINIHEVIGSVSLMMIDEKMVIGEIGFCFGQDFWGQGLATEVLNALLQYVFSLGYQAIICRSRQENNASIHVLEKCHMQFHQSKKVLWLKDQKYYVMNTYKITQKQFELWNPS